MQLSVVVIKGRSEGVAERDIGSLRMMGWGLMLPENSSVAAAVAAVTGPPGGGKVKNPLNNLGASHRSTLLVRKKSKIRSII